MKMNRPVPAFFLKKALHQRHRAFPLQLRKPAVWIEPLPQKAVRAVAVNLSLQEHQHPLIKGYHSRPPLLPEKIAHQGAVGPERSHELGCVFLFLRPSSFLKKTGRKLTFTQSGLPA